MTGDTKKVGQSFHPVSCQFKDQGNTQMPTLVGKIQSKFTLDGALLALGSIR